ncbi:hypothetical protein AURDEDRAFT_115459 [Auricularia subglabra TFB-10046 SS5]|uniref:Uncharacterized protein n=1 Tax=Auricularia subglabra (strain TFB-10046 / SS5) TaxID=717982 RepID=J0WYM8_AURST|nr:hypothetical protein AURDEDRAFT_115459 [Auricularia subglabra TFB-10046 SS5]
MAPAIDVFNSTFFAGIASTMAFSAPDSTDTWYLSLLNIIRRMFQAIGKAAHDFYVNTLQLYAEAYWEHARTFVAEHHTECIIAGVVISILAMAYLLPQAFMLFLRALGYTARGVAEGSVAAAHQSARLGGYIAKGSWFAIAQSLPAGGRCFSALPWPFAVLAVILLGIGITMLVMAGKARS